MRNDMKSEHIYISLIFVSMKRGKADVSLTTPRGILSNVFFLISSFKDTLHIIVCVKHLSLTQEEFVEELSCCLSHSTYFAEHLASTYKRALNTGIN